jgi:FAD synthase
VLQTPQKEADSPILRNLQTVHVEYTWAGDEFSLARNCQGAMEQLQNAKRKLDLLPADRVTVEMTNINNETKLVSAGCPTSAG